MNWIVENIWKNDYLVNWLSAIGTVGAVWVSLWLARDKHNDKRITGMLFDYNIWKSKGASYEEDATYYQETVHVEGYIQIYNPTEENKYIYDLKINAYFEHKGLIRIKESEFYNGDYNKIIYFKLQPKDALVESINIIFQREKSKEENQREFSVKKIDLIGKNENQQNVTINIYKQEKTPI